MFNFLDNLGPCFPDMGVNMEQSVLGLPEIREIADKQCNYRVFRVLQSILVIDVFNKLVVFLLDFLDVLIEHFGIDGEVLPIQQVLMDFSDLLDIGCQDRLRLADYSLG